MTARLQKKCIEGIPDFVKTDVRAILRNRFVVIIGDSVMRSIYKDLIGCLRTNELLSLSELRCKGEYSFRGDKLIEGGRLAEMTNGKNYREIRQYQTDQFLVRFYFVTRSYNTYVETILTDLFHKPYPDVVIANSCLWDITRYGPNGLESYKPNLRRLFGCLKAILKPSTLVIWTTALPVSEHVTGGVIIKEVKFLESILRLDLLVANYYASQVAEEYGFDVLDLHFKFRKYLDMRLADGIHWNEYATRKMNHVIIAHLFAALDVPWPRDALPLKSALQKNSIASGNAASSSTDVNQPEVGAGKPSDTATRASGVSSADYFADMTRQYKVATSKSADVPSPIRSLASPVPCPVGLAVCKVQPPSAVTSTAVTLPGLRSNLALSSTDLPSPNVTAAVSLSSCVPLSAKRRLQPPELDGSSKTSKLVCRSPSQPSQVRPRLHPLLCIYRQTASTSAVRVTSVSTAVVTPRSETKTVTAAISNVPASSSLQHGAACRPQTRDPRLLKMASVASESPSPAEVSCKTAAVGQAATDEGSSIRASHVGVLVPKATVAITVASVTAVQRTTSAASAAGAVATFTMLPGKMLMAEKYPQTVPAKSSSKHDLNDVFSVTQLRPRVPKVTCRPTPVSSSIERSRATSLVSATAADAKLYPIKFQLSSSTAEPSSTGSANSFTDAISSTQNQILCGISSSAVQSSSSSGAPVVKASICGETIDSLPAVVTSSQLASSSTPQVASAERASELQSRGLGSECETVFESGDAVGHTSGQNADVTTTSSPTPTGRKALLPTPPCIQLITSADHQSPSRSATSPTASSGIRPLLSPRQGNTLRALPPYQLVRWQSDPALVAVQPYYPGFFPPRIRPLVGWTMAGRRLFYSVSGTMLTRQLIPFGAMAGCIAPATPTPWWAFPVAYGSQVTLNAPAYMRRAIGQTPYGAPSHQLCRSVSESSLSADCIEEEDDSAAARIEEVNSDRQSAVPAEDDTQLTSPTAVRTAVAAADGETVDQHTDHSTGVELERGFHVLCSETVNSLVGAQKTSCSVSDVETRPSASVEIDESSAVQMSVATRDVTMSASAEAVGTGGSNTASYPVTYSSAAVVTYGTKIVWHNRVIASTASGIAATTLTDSVKSNDICPSVTTCTAVATRASAPNQPFVLQAGIESAAPPCVVTSAALSFSGGTHAPRVLPVAECESVPSAVGFVDMERGDDDVGNSSSGSDISIELSASELDCALTESSYVQDSAAAPAAESDSVGETASTAATVAFEQTDVPQKTPHVDAAGSAATTPSVVTSSEATVISTAIAVSATGHSSAVSAVEQVTSLNLGAESRKANSALILPLDTESGAGCTEAVVESTGPVQQTLPPFVAGSQPVTRADDFVFAVPLLPVRRLTAAARQRNAIAAVSGRSVASQTSVSAPSKSSMSGDSRAAVQATVASVRVTGSRSKTPITAHVTGNRKSVTPGIDSKITNEAERMDKIAELVRQNMERIASAQESLAKESLAKESSVQEPSASLSTNFAPFQSQPSAARDAEKGKSISSLSSSLSHRYNAAMAKAFHDRTAASDSGTVSCSTKLASSETASTSNYVPRRQSAPDSIVTSRVSTTSTARDARSTSSFSSPKRGQPVTPVSPDASRSSAVTRAVSSSSRCASPRSSTATTRMAMTSRFVMNKATTTAVASTSTAAGAKLSRPARKITIDIRGVSLAVTAATVAAAAAASAVVPLTTSSLRSTDSKASVTSVYSSMQGPPASKVSATVSTRQIKTTTTTTTANYSAAAAAQKRTSPYGTRAAVTLSATSAAAATAASTSVSKTTASSTSPRYSYPASTVRMEATCSPSPARAPSSGRLVPPPPPPRPPPPPSLPRRSPMPMPGSQNKVTSCSIVSSSPSTKSSTPVHKATSLSQSALTESTSPPCKRTKLMGYIETATAAAATATTATTTTLTTSTATRPLLATSLSSAESLIGAATTTTAANTTAAAAAAANTTTITTNSLSTLSLSSAKSLIGAATTATTAPATASSSRLTPSSSSVHGMVAKSHIGTTSTMPTQTQTGDEPFTRDSRTNSAAIVRTTTTTSQTVSSITVTLSSTTSVSIMNVPLAAASVAPSSSSTILSHVSAAAVDTQTARATQPSSSVVTLTLLRPPRHDGVDLNSRATDTTPETTPTDVKSSSSSSTTNSVVSHVLTSSDLSAVSSTLATAAAGCSVSTSAADCSVSSTPDVEINMLTPKSSSSATSVSSHSNNSSYTPALKTVVGRTANLTTTKTYYAPFTFGSKPAKKETQPVKIAPFLFDETKGKSTEVKEDPQPEPVRSAIAERAVECGGAGKEAEVCADIAGDLASSVVAVETEAVNTSSMDAVQNDESIENDRSMIEAQAMYIAGQLFRGLKKKLKKKVQAEVAANRSSTSLRKSAAKPAAAAALSDVTVYSRTVAMSSRALMPPAQGADFPIEESPVFPDVHHTRHSHFEFSTSNASEVWGMQQEDVAPDFPYLPLQQQYLFQRPDPFNFGGSPPRFPHPRFQSYHGRPFMPEMATGHTGAAYPYGYPYPAYEMPNQNPYYSGYNPPPPPPPPADANAGWTEMYGYYQYSATFADVVDDVTNADVTNSANRGGIPPAPPTAFEDVAIISDEAAVTVRYDDVETSCIDMDIGDGGSPASV